MQAEQIKFMKQKLSDYNQPEFLQNLINNNLSKITDWKFSHMGLDEEILPYIPELYGLKKKKKKKINELFVALDQNDTYHNHGYIAEKLSMILEPLSSEYKKDVMCYEYDQNITDRLTIEYHGYELQNNQFLFNENSITTLKAIRRSYWHDNSTLIAISVGLYSEPKSHVFYFDGGALKQVKIIQYDSTLSMVNELNYDIDDKQNYAYLLPKINNDFEEEKEQFSLIFSKLTKEQKNQVNHSIKNKEYIEIESLLKSKFQILSYDDQLKCFDILRGLLDNEEEMYLQLLQEEYDIVFESTQSFNSFLVQLIDYLQDVLEED